MAEAGEVRKLRIERDVRAYVEAARHVVHRHGRNARNEEALQRRVEIGREHLQVGEELLEEAVAVAQRFVRSVPALGEDRVGEVVVFVYDDVQVESATPKPRHYLRKFLSYVWRL